MKSRLALLVAWFLVACTVYAQPHKEIYRKVARYLSEDSSIFGEPDAPPALGDVEPDSNGSQVSWLTGKVSMKIDPTSHIVRSIQNVPLYEKLNETGYGKFKAKLTFGQAIHKAQDYLERYQIQFPKEARLKTVAFDHPPFPGAWEIRWEPLWSGFPQDDFISLPQTTWAIFNEDLGLQSVGTGAMPPSPVSLTVAISRDEAIIKAERLTDAVMHTPYYRMARRAGFKAVALDSCELKVVKPNWLLDPTRASWPSPDVVTKTRLCWMVRFNTEAISPDVDPKSEDGTPMKLKRPDIVIYIDAATGECVGAAFS